MKTTLSLKEVSALTGYSEGYIYQLTSKKKIPHYKPTQRKIIFDRAEVEAFIRKNKIQVN